MSGTLSGLSPCSVSAVSRTTASFDGHTSHRFFNPWHTGAMGIVQPESTRAGQAAKVRVVTGANIMAINQLKIAAKAVNSSRTGIFNLTDLYTINSEI